jgi:hypothetical protein
MKKTTILLISAFLFGCTGGQGGMFGPGKFEVTKADARFSKSKNQIFTSTNNRISSKSIAGGIHIDGTGVFVNPVLTKSEKSDEILLLGFSIENMTSHDTTYGSPNTLGAIQSIVFLINDSDPIVLKVRSGSADWSDVISYNSVTRSASSSIIESGIAYLSMGSYKKILSAQELAVKIQGSKRSVVYENKDISKSFISNLRHFYELYALEK